MAGWGRERSAPPGLRFTFRMARTLGPLFAVLGMGRSRSWVVVGDGHVDVRMGSAFRVRVPLSSVVAARRRPYVWWAYGVHGFRGRWIVNGSGHGIVVLELSPPGRARLGPLGIRLRELWVSLEDPDRFLRTIGH